MHSPRAGRTSNYWLILLINHDQWIQEYFCMKKLLVIALMAVCSTQYIHAETLSINGEKCFVTAPNMPKKAKQDGTVGQVKAEVRMINGIVKSVKMVSGPIVFYDAVETALMQYKCPNQKGESSFSQTFNFEFDDNQKENKTEDSPDRTMKADGSPEARQKTNIGFWEGIKGAASNRNENIAFQEVRQLLDDLRISMINSPPNDPKTLHCNFLEGTDTLFNAAVQLVFVRLPNVETPGARNQFQRDYESFKRICPLEIARGNTMLDNLSKILSEARVERMKQEDRSREIKETEMREEWNRKAETNRQLAEAKVEQDRLLAARRQEDAKARSQRINELKSGKVPIASISDAAAKLDAGDATMIVMRPPIYGDQKIYQGYGQVVAGIGGNFLVGKLGDKHFSLVHGASTVFLHDAKIRIRVGEMIYFVGRYLGGANTDGGTVASFVALYIDTGN